MSALILYNQFLQCVVDNTGVIVTFLTILLLMKLIQPQRPDNLPPGLYPWPIVGNLWELSKDPRENWSRLREKYGDIVSVYMGSQLTVILNSYDVIKEAFTSDSFAGRPKSFFFFQHIGELRGIASSSGDLWKEQRKFSLHLLRQFGLGRRSFEGRVAEEICKFLAVVRSYEGKPIDMRFLLDRATSNIIFSVVFGKRFTYSDPKFQACLEHIIDIMRDSGSTAILNILPWVKYLPGDLSKQKACIKHRNELQKFFRGLVTDVKTSYDNSCEPQNFVEAYLKKIEEEKKHNPDSNYHELQLLKIILDLFFGGAESSATTLRWSLLHLLKHPAMQVRMQREIDNATGGTRSPSIRDRLAMPFTEAFICEVQRYSDISPTGGPHATLEDTYLRGYFIPKDTLVFSNLHMALHDKAFWGDPETFRPSRFLDDQEKFVKPDQFLAFSTGKRLCPGESLARRMLFLFVTAMLQNFNFRLPEGATLPDMKGRFGATVSTPEFEICGEIRE